MATCGAYSSKPKLPLASRLLAHFPSSPPLNSHQLRGFPPPSYSLPYNLLFLQAALTGVFPSSALLLLLSLCFLCSLSTASPTPLLQTALAMSIQLTMFSLLRSLSALDFFQMPLAVFSLISKIKTLPLHTLWSGYGVSLYT